MSKPKLVVLTGYGCVGKSYLSKYLMDHEGFIRISGDDVLGDLQKGLIESNGLDDNEVVWYHLAERIGNALGQGKERIVVDTTAYNNHRRSQLLSTGSGCEKYLVWVKAENKKLNKDRFEGRGGWGSIGYLPVVDLNWEDPVIGNGYKLIVFENNSNQEGYWREKITQLKKDLEIKGR